MKTLTIYQMEELSYEGGMSDRCRRASITWGLAIGISMITGELTG